MSKRCLLPTLASAFFAVVISSAQTTGPIQPADWQVLYHEDFEHGMPGDWDLSASVGPGTGWTLEKEGSNTYLAATGHVTAPLRLGPWGDFRFKVRVRMIDDGVHLNYRTSGCNRYIVPFHTWGLQMVPVRPDCVGPGVVQSVNASFALNTWYTVEIVGIGGDIRVYVDGALKTEYVDLTPLAAGSVSLECLSHAHFDDVEVSGPAQPQGPAWVRTGGPIGGIGYDIKMRPDNPDTLYVTDAYSGLHMSGDGGRTWAPSNQGISSRTGVSGDAIPVFCVTVDPNAPDTVWAGTQNQRGIFKSTDGGKTWTEKTKGIVEQTGISVRGIVVDPHDSRVVYAAGEISSFVWAGETRYGREFDLTEGVVYKSADGGDNWTAIWRGDNLARYVWIDPRDSSVLYVSTGIFDREAANSDLLHGIPGGVGILKSSDGGKTWRTLNQNNGLTNLYIGSLFMHPANPDILLAGAGLIGHPNPGGIFLSTDGGEHWQRGVDTGGHTIQTRITSVEFAVLNPKIAYACGDEMFFRSEDGGASWRLIAGQSGGRYGPPGISTGFPIDLQADPRNPYRVFINNYGGGNFLSEDGGATWNIASKGYTGAQVKGVAVSAGDWQRVYAIGNSGVFRSDDAGENWQGLNYPPSLFASTNPGSVAVAPDKAEWLLMSDQGSGLIWRSDDGGRNWKVVFSLPGLASTPGNTHSFKSIVFAPSDSRVVFAGIRRESAVPLLDPNAPSFGVYKSVDGGATWQAANDATSAGQNVNALAVDGTDPNVVYAGTTQHGVLRTRDGGRSWVVASQGLPLTDVRSLAIDPTDSKTLYAGLENGGLFKSIDNGDHWQRNGVGMDTQAQVHAIVIDPANPQTIYAADLHSGVYRSQDQGNLWVQIDFGLRTRAVEAMAISSDGATLYAATQGEGVFRLDLKTESETAVAAVSAASFISGAPLAPDSLVSLFGQGLAPALTLADAPVTTLAGISVGITDSAGTDVFAPLFFVSPDQINLQVPAGTATGQAAVRVFQQSVVAARGQASIAQVSPALFTANVTGKGAAAGIALRVAAGGQQSQLDVYRCGAAQGSCAPVPIDLGAATDQVFLELFGTGIRGRSALAATTATIGGQAADVVYAGPQGSFMGLDQVNIRVPRSLAGRGVVDVVLTVEGKTANTVTVNIL
jgi:uncharacterized protein (TIGR03437 family)